MEKIKIKVATYIEHFDIIRNTSICANYHCATCFCVACGRVTSSGRGCSRYEFEGSRATALISGIINRNNCCLFCKNSNRCEDFCSKCSSIYRDPDTGELTWRKR
jgi:hypothetical protein